MGHFNLCSDRQTYILNWSRREDKRNIAFRALATAEIFSGFIFPIDVNYDPHVNRANVNRDAVNSGDWMLSPALREKPQYWLDTDYSLESLKNFKRQRGVDQANPYEAAIARDDVESPDDNISVTSTLPNEGMQLREDYTMYAHFRRLSRYLASSDLICFHTEQESGIRAAIFGNFVEKIKSKRVRHFYVDCYKQPTRDMREKASAEGKQIVSAAKSAFNCDEALAYHSLLLDAQKHTETRGHWGDQWFRFPVPTYAEVQKDLCHMTAFNDDDPHETATLARWATILPVDNFFQIVRRRLSPLERPVTSASAEGRKWTGKAPYNPAMTIKLLGKVCTTSRI